ncbi:MAG: ATP-binding protein [Gordonia sp. (in: high G+C Gram-positive bacteria)]|uniref:sensor histidine kinase n=1 Tax=Gordonia sp. (in: high G+C Gram-positive bacteria) TaxID=84139 RepID=UPI0039E702B2
MTPDGIPAQRRVRTVRVQLTLVSSLLVAVALAIAGVSMAVALNHLLTNAADSAGTARAEHIAATLAKGGLKSVTGTMLMPAGDVDVVQIVDADSEVLRASAIEHDEPLAPPVPPGELDHVNVSDDRFDDHYRSTVIGTSTPRDGDLTVLVAFSARPIDQTVIIVVVLCCLIFPFVVIAMGWLTYHFAGRALQSVEDIRAHAAEITGGDLSRRLPVPEADDEIAALATTMNEMLTRLENARLQQSRFVNDASHELNSPLTSILGIVEFAASSDSGIDAATVSSLLLPESLQLKRLISDLLFLARADEHGVPKNDVAIDLDDIIGSEVTRLRQTSGLRVGADIVAARVVGDHAQLTRAFRNLGDNAMTHAESAIALTMSVDDHAREVTVLVIDDGPGIPCEDRERVFERFVRLDDARVRRAGGSGLGLAIVAEIAQAHHGRVGLRHVEQGTTIAFTLPLDGGYPPSASSR